MLPQTDPDQPPTPDEIADMTAAETMAEAAYVSMIVNQAMVAAGRAKPLTRLTLTPTADGAVRVSRDAAPAPVRSMRPDAPVRMPRPDAAPDVDAWEALMANMPRAAAAANRDPEARNANGKPFDSASEFDMSLANAMGQCGWTAQEIADALAWNRRRRGEDPKHRTYYAKTAGRALEARS